MTSYEPLFSWIDLPFIAILIVVELLLSADNAGVLAYLVKELPYEKKRTALRVGLISAVFFRALGVLFVAYLISFFWMQIVGGLYLIYLPLQHLWQKHTSKQPVTQASFWKTVCKVELMDLLFAIDSILAAFGLGALYYSPLILPHKLWAVYLGGLIGIVLMRFATIKVIKWLEIHPRLFNAVFFLVGWVGLKLIVGGVLYFVPTPWIHHFFGILFGVGALVIILVGFLSTKSSQRG